MMNNSFILAALGYAIRLLLVSAEETTIQSCGKSNQVEDSVLSSTGLKAGEYPWYVSLYKKQDNSFDQICGGTIISPRIILTAGHCAHGGGVTAAKASDLKVAVGKYDNNWDVEEKNAQKLDIERIAMHPSYKMDGSNVTSDLALLILSSDIKPSRMALPACVDWTGSQSVLNGNVGSLVSWNRTKYNFKKNETKLREINGTFMDASTCLQKAPEPLKRFIAPDRFCINYSNDTGLGLGDSGAGLTVEKDGRHYLVGVGGWGSPKISPIFVFTSIASYKDWIQSVLNSEDPSS